MNTITGYMDISLLVSGNQGVHKKPFAPVDLLDELYKNVAADCKSKSLTLKPVLLPAGNKFRINSDFGLLQKAMQHLLANAIKFTLQGEISFGMEVKEDILLFWVKDTGVGITTEAQGLIFDKFMQENVSSTRGYEGSGLGLSIVKGIVELLEGNIWLESQKGKGASFYFTIPFDVSGVETTDLHDLKIIPGDHPLILIAEDEASNSLFLERLLRKQGFDVIIVRDGRMAVDVCRQNASVSLVLMDLKMPVLDGIQATKEIKSFRSALPVIAVTAYAMSSDETNALEAGCDDYIAKPYNQDALLSKIKKLGCYPLPSVLAPSVS
jgi:CheY-like chemotaxis protein